MFTPPPRLCVRNGGCHIYQRGSEFIDGVALEEYADEQDDYAQEREIEACIKAVDVDCDGKIGKIARTETGNDNIA